MASVRSEARKRTPPVEVNVADPESRLALFRVAPGRLTEVIVEESRAGADRQSILQFMTTEHFTLQTARAAANAEISSRLQLYLGTLSSSIIALALTAQPSGLGFAFRAFALVLRRRRR